MRYTCPMCGWVKENQPSHHTTEEDYQAIFEHERSHGRLDGERR